MDMKRLKTLPLVLVALCAGFAFVACDNDDDEPKLTIDPVMGTAEWAAGEYVGTTLTDLDSRGMVMRIDTTYDQPLTLGLNEQKELVLTYHNWTDHTGMSYGDFRILPLETVATEEGVVVTGECTDSLYKAGVGYPATLKVAGTISGESKVADLTMNIDLVVSPKMTLKFTLEYEGAAE